MKAFVGKPFVHFSCLPSSTRLWASSGLFFSVHCPFKNSKTARSMPTFLFRASTDPWKPPTSQKYCNLQAKAALWAKTHGFLIRFPPVDSGGPSGSFEAPVLLAPPSWPRPLTEPWKPPTSQKYCNLQVKAALWAKTYGF